VLCLCVSLLSTSKPDYQLLQILVWMLCHWRPFQYLIFKDFLQLVITAWQTHQPVRWEWH
jgi:hypothetical protein